MFLARTAESLDDRSPGCAPTHAKHAKYLVCLKPSYLLARIMSRHLVHCRDYIVHILVAHRVKHWQADKLFIRVFCGWIFTTLESETVAVVPLLACHGSASTPLDDLLLLLFRGRLGVLR